MAMMIRAGDTLGRKPSPEQIFTGTSKEVATGLIIAGSILTVLGTAMMIATAPHIYDGGGFDGLLFIFSAFVVTGRLGILIPGIIMKSK